MMNAPDRRPRTPRKREYVLYSMDRYALRLTGRADLADRLLHRWVFTVYAYSIRQAYYLANEHAWAGGPGEVGIRRIELDRGYRRDLSAEEARLQGLIQQAPYLDREGPTHRRRGEARES